MLQWPRPHLANRALAVPVLAGVFLLLLAPSPRAQDPFILSLAAAIDETSLTPRERLGLRLFFDTSMSEPAGVACASCHDPRRAFTGNNSTMMGVARGSRSDQFGKRDAPTLMYLATTPRFGSVERGGKRVPSGGLFWDGRADTLEEQAKQPLVNEVEMNNADTPALIAKVARSAYAAEFRKVWGDAIFDDPEAALDAVASSIAAFERTRTFQPFTSKFDYVMRGEAKFTEQEQRGWSLFTMPQKGNCAHCHIVDKASRDPTKSLFTDFSFHALGVPRSKRIPKNADPAFNDLGLCDRVPVSGAKPPAKDPAACGLFKTPTLRNVTVTAPYMHNGFFENLRDAVAFYATRDTDPARWYPDGKKFNDLPAQYHANVNVDTPPYQRRPKQPPQLTDEEIDDIVEFLYTLTDGYKPARK
ncbi:MAG TPA: cytochrome c peroxidase [Burkholderiales bacterium]|nr:cytochrome c peroxidase [Burkholderiales bacterium]